MSAPQSFIPKSQVKEEIKEETFSWGKLSLESFYTPTSLLICFLEWFAAEISMESQA